MSDAVFLLSYGAIWAVAGGAATAIGFYWRDERRERRRHAKISRRSPVLARWRLTTARATTARHRAGEVRPAADQRDVDAPTRPLSRRVDPDATAVIDMGAIRRD